MPQAQSPVHSASSGARGRAGSGLAYTQATGQALAAMVDFVRRVRSQPIPGTASGRQSQSQQASQRTSMIGNAALRGRVFPQGLWDWVALLDPARCAERACGPGVGVRRGSLPWLARLLAEY